MSTKQLIALLIALCGIAAVFFILSPHPAAIWPESAVSSPVQEQGVRETVEGLGTKLKMVSLLAPAKDLKSAMEQYYAPYITPELLSKWVAEPSSALGRSTSSPWPDRIVFDEMQAQIDGSYLAHGRVVEVTSDDMDAVAALYPVTLRLVKRDDAWLVTEASKGPYADLSGETTIEGEYECLPHRDTEGPQTLECALGIRADSGRHYALDTSLLKGGFLTLSTGARLRVVGSLVSTESLNSDTWRKYNIEGIIRATSVASLSS